ncbi:MAG: hypothetical protein NZO58_09570, partial [Gemmataceae bacterium]|nr:hypothetical protein [Gemmataceae bacterium]
MSSSGWHQLLPSAPLFRGAGLYPIDAYSEFTPPPRRGWTPYTGVDRESGVFNPEDPNGWYVDEFDEAGQLQPGLAQIAAQLVERTRALTHGGHGHGFAPRLLYGNVYWPEPLQARTGSLRHDACVVLTPLALSQTIDEFGRLRWTLFGGSDQGPGRAFWKSFADGAASAVADAGPRFLTNLLRTVFRLDIPSHDELAATGFRILPQGQAPLPGWDESLPDWTRPYLADDGADFTAIRYLLTFRPFGQLPASARQAYLEGRLQLLPSPASLVYWGMPEILRLHHELPLALQVPLLLHAAAPDAATGLRVPPAGLLHEPAPGRNDDVPPALVRNTIRRRRRWDRVERDCALPPGSESEDKLLHALFSSDPDDVRLYDKPLARNVQLWTLEGRLLLDGPSAALDDIKQAMETVLAGGVFGYRFVYPALRVGRHEVFWHRTVAAYYCNEKQKALLLDEAPLGYLTCYATVPGDGAGPQAVRAQYRVGHDAWQRPVELWPRLHRRPLPMALLALAQPSSPSDVVAAVRNLVDAYHGRGNTPLPRRLAHDLAAVPREVPLKDWLETLPTANIYDGVTAILEPKETPLPRRPGARTPESLTYHATSRRSFETAFWKLLTILAEGRFLNKNNADCVRDAATQRLLPYAGRHLDALADFLADYHRQKVAATAPNVPAVVGEHRFRWQTDFDYSWMEGWQANQEQAAERNIVVVIPGRDRSRAVVLAAHYDTAY